MKYTRLFEKGQIGKLKLKNRIVMPPMGTNLASLSGEPGNDLIRFYEERAKGGCGLIISEICRVDELHGIGMPAQICATKFDYVPGLEKMVNTVHKYGTKMFIQLHHPGRQGVPMFNNGSSVGPSPIPLNSPILNSVPKELTNAEVKELVQKFVMGAIIGKEAGFDGVELHAAHGYLLQQFFSPEANQRTDEYGGNFENRMRFITEIIHGIRMACGPDFPISVRLSAAEFTEAGYDLAYGVEIAKHLEKSGVDALNVSNGNYESDYTIMEPRSYDQGWKAFMGKAIKEAVTIPVIAVDMLRKPDFAEKMLEESNCDFVALARAQLADPEWCRKTKEGREDEIRPCISCLYCLSQVSTGKVFKCTMNARLSRELEFPEWPVISEDRTVAVIGAGPAGMEASRVLAERGYKVVLFEKNSYLGGSINLANKPPHQHMLQWMIDYYRVQLEKLGVDVRLNTTATANIVKELNPYAVFVAIGAKPIVPRFEGIDQPDVYMYHEILDGTVELTGKKIALIGGGLVGCETAQFLSERGNETYVIEMAKDICSGDYVTNVVDTKIQMGKYNVQTLVSHKVDKITPDGVQTITEDGSEKLVTADAVIICIGAHPDQEAISEFTDICENVQVLGDSIKAGKFTEAIRSGFTQAYVL